MNVNGRLTKLENSEPSPARPGPDFSRLSDSTIDFLLTVRRLPDAAAEEALARWAALNPDQFAELQQALAGVQ
jgi:hypothetical protein